MDELEQIIVCPNCTSGWFRLAGLRRDDWHECPICETRGLLVIDGKKTLALATIKTAITSHKGGIGDDLNHRSGDTQNR